ncbi:MAG TPA: autotransporter-associated beta strand repeat-containing protein, partial [Kiritimatiellia bacterium]|nr:autotransporter-associated beta strand repeat-containing protein [Kiritimatiellia bacterium]
GAAASAAACTVSNGATLRLSNIAAANNTDRLADAGPVTLLGGTLDFSHDAGAADFSESAGALIAADGACTVQTDQAAEDQTSMLTFASLARLNGATLSFTGTGLGASARNRVFITGQPEGPLGDWVTLNGQPAYYSVTDGVTAPPTLAVTEIAARGPDSVIPDDATADVRITQPGTDGPITLAGDPVNSVAYLRQCTDTAAEVDTANKTLFAYSVGITNGQAALKLGLSVGDGALAPLTPGGTLALNNASGSALTVNAALADNTAASSVAKYGAGNATIAGPTLHTGATEIHEGTLTFAGHDVTQRLAGAVSGIGTLVKTGTNLLDLAAANSGFAGPIQVQQGVLLIRRTGALGTADGGTVISDGATLDVGGSDTMDSIVTGPEPVTAQGAGADGQGVIVNRSGVQQIYALGNLELAGDATFGGLSRWDIRNGTFNMNNHSVTKTGGAALGLSGTETVTPGGDDASIDVQEGSLRLQQSLQMGGSAANTVHLRSGTMLDFYDLTDAPAWSLICEDNTALRATLGDNTSHNRWAGPVTLNGAFRAVFEAESDYRSGFAGDVSGPGSLLVTNTTSKQPRFSLTGTNNTYRGATRIVNSWIFANSLKNVGEPSSLGQPMNAADGTIRLGIGDLPGRLAYTGSGDTTDRTIELSGSSTAGWGTLNHEGTGPLVISNVTFAAGAKRLYLIGNSTYPATIISDLVDSGSGNTELVKQNNGTWILSGDNTYSGQTTLSEGGYGTLTYTGSNTLAGAFAIENGILRLPAGATMKSAANFGIRRGGAFHLDGGTFIRNTPTPDGETFSIGHSAGGYGHLAVNSGSLTCTRLYAGWSGIGTTRFTGGAAAFTHFVHVGRFSYGTVTIMPGGSVSQPEITDDNDCYLGFDGGRGELNLLGGDYLQARGKFQAGQNSAAGTSVVNLCQGTLTTRYLAYSKGALFVNFAGGTLKYPDLTAVAVPLIPNHAAVHVYSYGPRDGFAGGAEIDTNGQDMSLPAAVRAPAGQGVSAIEIQQKGSRYVGEPYVRISGDGFGACAVANMEDDGQGRGTYRVASVTVTCPGVNYTTPPTVTFLGGACIVTAQVSTVTLAPNTGGGLTKSGTGTLTVSGANTYTGATTVAAGTLKLGAAQALPDSTPVALAGGTLDLNGATVTNALSGSGTLANGTVETVLSPAGAGTVGADAITLTGAALRGTYQADVTAAGACDLVAITGDIDLAQLILQLVDPLALNRQQAYTILTCTGTRSGAFAGTNLPQGW